MQREAYLEMAKIETHHWCFVARRMIIQKTLNTYFQDAKTLKILEVGCGSGGNLELLSAYGKLHAMEMDNEARASLSQNNDPTRAPTIGEQGKEGFSQAEACGYRVSVGQKCFE